MPRVGTVIRTIDSRAWISTSRRGVCDDCRESASCTFEKALSKGKTEEVLAENPLGACPGDLVEFDLEGHTELKISLLVWAVPLAGLIGGAALGAGLHERLAMAGDPATLLGAAIGLTLAFLLVLFCDRRCAHDPRLVPKILKVLRSGPCPSLDKDRN